MGASSMININTEIIKKIETIKEYLSVVVQYTVLSKDELLKNIEKLSTMERHFQLMADQAFEINSVLAYQLGNKIPESNKSTFYELADLNIIDKHFAEKIAESAKIRNSLIHSYEKVQKSVLIDEIKKFTEMYKEYISILIKKFMPVDNTNE